MQGAPRAASAWLSDPVAGGRRGWGKDQRLLRASEFVALTGAGTCWRAARRWIAVSARVAAPPAVRAPAACGSSFEHLLVVANVRFGITVSKRQARRAVARNMVKRVLRESARHAATALQTAVAGARADVVFRLKSPLPGAEATTWLALKAELRREADSLLEQLRDRLVQARPQPWQVLAQSADGARAAVANSAGAQS